jgi:hypothetical protein
MLSTGSSGKLPIVAKNGESGVSAERGEPKRQPRKHRGICARVEISRETLLLLAICLLDAVSSAVLFHRGMAVEANPLLRPFAEAGPLSLICVKMAWTVAALAILESYRQRHPDMVTPLIRLGSAAYVTIYAALVGAQFFR